MPLIVVTDAGSRQGRVRVTNLDSGKSVEVPKTASAVAAARKEVAR